MYSEHAMTGISSCVRSRKGGEQDNKRDNKNYLDKLALWLIHRICESAANNLPDAAAERAAKEILAVARRATADDLVMVLISGGGSALLPCPVQGVTLQEKRQVSPYSVESIPSGVHITLFASLYTLIPFAHVLFCFCFCFLLFCFRLQNNWQRQELQFMS